jgi:DNA-binding XRE family transcriptional regulator
VTCNSSARSSASRATGGGSLRTVLCLAGWIRVCPERRLKEDGRFQQLDRMAEAHALGLHHPVDDRRTARVASAQAVPEILSRSDDQRRRPVVVERALAQQVGPCRVSLIPRASANRCTEISFFSRSTSCSGIRAIFSPPPKNLSSTFFSQEAFAKRLRSTPRHFLRQARGLTQVQLAKATGMTQRAISYYEIEAEFPPAPALITLSQALEVSTDELLGVQPATPTGACAIR